MDISTPRSSRLWRAVLGVRVELLLTALGIASIAYILDPHTFEGLAGATAAIGFFVAGLRLDRYGRTTDQGDATTFRLIGIGLMLGSAGMVAFPIAAELIDLPSFGPFDAVFIVMYVLLIASLAFMPSARSNWRTQVRIVIDGLVGALAVSALIWEVVGSEIVANLSALSTPQRVIGFTYPILDLALLVSAMVLVARRGRHQFDPRLMTLSVAFASQVAADLSYLSSAGTGLFADTEPNLLFFLASSSAFLVTARLVHRAPEPIESPEASTPVWSYVMPYGIGAIMLAVVIWQTVADRDPSVHLQLGTLLVLILVIARQTLAIQEHRSMVEAERRSLIASVSHELRTPLTSLIGFLSLLEDGDLEAHDRAEMTSIAVSQANHMGRMVTDIVMLARDTPHLLALDKRLVDAEAFVESLLATMDGGRSSIETDVEPDLMLALDTDRVSQIATNLLSNAGRYGGERVLLVVKGVAQRNTLAIEVHDDGSGVEKRHQRKIWDRFERGQNQLNAAVPGTGLGLAIVVMIAKAHGGSAAYRTSERLGGACFSVHLPSSTVSDPESATRHTADPAHSAV